MSQKFVTVFFLSFIFLLAALLFFTTWMDPMKTIQAPWSIDFTSDRNSSYIKFKRLQENNNFTDLIVGSSTSEVVLPKTIQEKYQVNAFLAGDGGASTAVRYLYMQEAIRSKPQLKRILYVADLFEFKNLTIENQIYYQKDLMAALDTTTLSLITPPSAISRIYDFISQKALQNSAKTLKDYRQYKEGTYQSQYHLDGTTDKSMVTFRSEESIESRSLRLAQGYKNVYGDMNQLHEPTKALYRNMAQLAKEKNMQWIIIIPPWHSIFYKQFEVHFQKTKIFEDWLLFIKSLASENIKIIDFSYPISLQKGITDEEVFWHDGVHFSKEAANIILQEVYVK